MATEPLPLSRFPRFIRYASAGAIGTSVHYVTLIALVQGALARPVAASTAGALAGAVVNYLLNHRFTFRSDRAHAHAAPRFAVVTGAGVVLNAVVLALVLSLLGTHYVVAQVVATGVVLVCGYLANRAWTF